MVEFNLKELNILSKKIKHIIQVLEFFEVNCVDDLSDEATIRLADKLDRIEKEN